MTYEFTAERAPTYLHVTGRGEHTAENLRRLLLDAYRSAIEQHCSTLLIELNFMPQYDGGSWLGPRRGTKS